MNLSSTESADCIDDYFSYISMAFNGILSILIVVSEYQALSKCSKSNGIIHTFTLQAEKVIERSKTKELIQISQKV